MKVNVIPPEPKEETIRREHGRFSILIVKPPPKPVETKSNRSATSSQRPYKKQSGMELTMPELEWDT